MVRWSGEPWRIGKSSARTVVEGQTVPGNISLRISGPHLNCGTVFIRYTPMMDILGLSGSTFGSGGHNMSHGSVTSRTMLGYGGLGLSVDVVER